MNTDVTWTHFDREGRPRMVDVGHKPATERMAVATAEVHMHPRTRALIEARGLKKGDVLTVAELAGVMAAKKTSDLIPLCHPLPLSHAQVRCQWRETEGETAVLQLIAEVKTIYATGVEMEALTACSVAALTVYDMCKAVDRELVIASVQLVYKAGGRSGVYQRPGADELLGPASP
ncbi:MAG: cyclic pyranopterin monophosphate synthase MoaC [Alicyclobacillus sp.]|nr:cyclic pyranopterin monophosphate synthase MoaC [Alicyclobacillus sp.]